MQSCFITHLLILVTPCTWRRSDTCVWNSLIWKKRLTAYFIKFIFRGTHARAHARRQSRTYLFRFVKILWTHASTFSCAVVCVSMLLKVSCEVPKVYCVCVRARSLGVSRDISSCTKTAVVFATRGSRSDTKKRRKKERKKGRKKGRKKETSLLSRWNKELPEPFTGGPRCKFKIYAFKTLLLEVFSPIRKPCKCERAHCALISNRARTHTHKLLQRQWDVKFARAVEFI